LENEWFFKQDNDSSEIEFHVDFELKNKILNVLMIKSFDLGLKKIADSFEKRAIQSAKDGMIPCPINVNPNWTYDWESHILKAQSKQVKRLKPGPMGQQGLMNSTQDVE